MLGGRDHPSGKQVKDGLRLPPTTPLYWKREVKRRAWAGVSHSLSSLPPLLFQFRGGGSMAGEGLELLLAFLLWEGLQLHTMSPEQRRVVSWGCGRAPAVSEATSATCQTAQSGA